MNILGIYRLKYCNSSSGLYSQKTQNHTMQGNTSPTEWYMSNGHSTNLHVMQTSHKWVHFIYFLSYRRRQWKKQRWKTIQRYGKYHCVYLIPLKQFCLELHPFKGAKIAFCGSSLSKRLWKMYSLSRSYLFIVANLQPNLSSIFLYKFFSALSLIKRAVVERLAKFNVYRYIGCIINQPTGPDLLA